MNNHSLEHEVCIDLFEGMNKLNKNSNKFNLDLLKLSLDRLVNDKSFEYKNVANEIVGTAYLLMLDLPNAKKYYDLIPSSTKLKNLSNVARWYGKYPRLVKELSNEETYKNYLVKSALPNLRLVNFEDIFVFDDESLYFILNEFKRLNIDTGSVIKKTVLELDSTNNKNFPKRKLLAELLGIHELIIKEKENFNYVLNNNHRSKININFQIYALLNNYEFIKTIQQGDDSNFFPTVSNMFLVEKNNKKQVFKENIKLYVDFSKHDGYNKEKEIYSKISHPNIINYNGSMDIDSHEFLMFDFFEGKELTEFTKKDNLLPVKESTKIINELSKTLEYLHKNGILYLDIKDKNVLYDGQNIKLLDFGMAQMFDKPIEFNTTAKSLLSTPTYIPPEWGNKFTATSQAESFQLGILYYQLLTGEHPFAKYDFIEDNSRECEVIKSLQNIYCDMKPLPKSINNNEIISLLDSVLNKDPAYRILPESIYSSLDEVAL